MLKLIGIAILCTLAFAVGIAVGITDCKRRFGIPMGEMPNE